jgi:putative hydrolase of the HAD superfamily
MPNNETSASRQVPGFGATQAWIFDLDNTLYPAECHLFAQIDRRMGEFIANYLGVPIDYARHLQKSYYRQFGTTLSGLMQVHKVPPRQFLDYVHDIDLSVLPAHPELALAIERLPGRRLIFTNGSRWHAERVAEKLGVLHLFEAIWDIEACEYVPKPHANAYRSLIAKYGITGNRAAMFEMTTVLVHAPGFDHPIQRAILEWREPPDHVHHITDNLAGFLGALGIEASVTKEGIG